jgi:hypothetical protein
MAEQPKSTKRLFKYPFVFSSQMATTGDGTLINGGQVIAGDTRTFPLDNFANALTRPFVVKRIKYTVTRPGGGDEVDSDYDNVLTNIRDLVRNEDLTKDPVALSVLCDKERREWIFHPGELILRKMGGGLRIEVQTREGAVGAPYNISVAVHGYTEERAEPAEGMFPEEV